MKVDKSQIRNQKSETNSNIKIQMTKTWVAPVLGFRFRTSALLLLAVLLMGGIGMGTAAAVGLEESGPPNLDPLFLRPTQPYKPWAYWWWLNANVTRQSITRDLEEMKKKGLGGFLLFDVTEYGHELVPPPKRRVPFMSPQWRELVRFAMREADRLGLEMSMNLSTCGGALRAPWSMKEHAAKRLVFALETVRGPKQLKWKVDRPQQAFFWDVAAVAYRHADARRPARPLIPWQPAVLKPSPNAPLMDRCEVLPQKPDQEGCLTWTVPEGDWTVVRLGCEVMEGREKDVDILNPRAVATHFEQLGAVIVKDAGPLAGKTLTHFYNVSWEGTSPTWTPGFEKDFEEFRGYSIFSGLGVLAGLNFQSADWSDRFREDYLRTLGDCFLHHCYGQFTELCHQAGLKWHAESGGPWRNDPLLSQADSLAFWGINDMPQGEFWFRPIRSNARHTAMAAHIYGKRLASIEAFTHMRPHWSAYPAALKPVADAAYADGINRFVWHTFSASPPEFGRPGIVYFAGTHLNPNVTWWEQAGSILDYLGRCQVLLQQGQFVADACCYTGNRIATNWTRGQKFFEKSTLTLPRGYSYDLVNTEVLLNRLSFQNGRLVLPDGMNYRLLVVDLEKEVVPSRAVEKILELARAGATIVLGPRRPTRVPGLGTDTDERLRDLADQLWRKEAGAHARPFGKGKVIQGQDLAPVLAAEKILPDCDSPCDYLHRHTKDLDLFFLSGEGNVEPVFRVADREPELWDPRTGEIHDAVHYRRTEDGRTVVPLQLPASGSLFVVFRRPAHQQHLVAAPTAGLEIVGRTSAGAVVHQWQPGLGPLETSKGKRLSLKASALPEPVVLDGSWQVHFTPGQGAPASVRWDKLVPWNEQPEEGIKYYSGTATYRKSLELSEKQAGGLVRLHLGAVNHVARVRVNGKDLGVVWCAPWSIDLTGAVKPGRNELEIDVTNTWANRLIGDARLPESRGFTRTNVRLETGKRTLKPFQSYSSEDPLMESGLLGPVRLEFGVKVEVGF